VQKKLTGQFIITAATVNEDCTLILCAKIISILLDLHSYCLCMQVYLEQEDGRGCIFKILPCYKIQSIGEEIRFSDQVKLESVTTEGQFLHCSGKTFGEVHININKDWLIATA
jgi:hypothetical protein